MPRLSQRASLVVAVGIGFCTLPLSGQAPVDQAPVSAPAAISRGTTPGADRTAGAPGHAASGPSTIARRLLARPFGEGARCREGFRARGRRTGLRGRRLFRRRLAASRRPTGGGALSAVRPFLSGPLESAAVACRRRRQGVRRSDRAQSGWLSVGGRVAGEGRGEGAGGRSWRGRGFVRAGVHAQGAGTRGRPGAARPGGARGRRSAARGQCVSPCLL